MSPNSDVSRVSEMSLQLYLRTSGSMNDPSTNDELGKSDVFMGNLMFIPDFDRVVSSRSNPPLHPFHLNSFSTGSSKRMVPNLQRTRSNQHLHRVPSKPRPIPNHRLFRPPQSNRKGIIRDRHASPKTRYRSDLRAQNDKKGSYRFEE